MSTEHPEDRVEKLRSGLLSATVDRKKKLALLKKLVEHKADPRVLTILKESAVAPVNQSILGYVVRSFGYLSGPEPLAELAKYLGHTSRVVVGNAVKGMITVDRKEAVRLAIGVVRGPNPDTAVAAARVLAERCHADCHAQFVEMSASPRAADRYAALVYLRFLPGGEAIPVLLEMLRRETEPELYPVITRMLPKLIPRSASGPLEALRSELAAKLVELDAALDALPDGATFDLNPAPEEADPEFPDALLTTDYLPARKRDSAEPLGAAAFSAPTNKATTTGAVQAIRAPEGALVSGGVPKVRPPTALPPPTGPTASGGLQKLPPLETQVPPAGPTVSGAVQQVRPPPAAVVSGASPKLARPVAPPPEEQPSSEPAPALAGKAPAASATASGALATVEPPPAATASAANPAVPWQKKQLKKQQDRLRNITRAFRLDQLPDLTRKSPMLVGSVLTIVVYLAFLVFGRGGVVAPPPRVSDIPEGVLGKVGAHIKFSGTLIEVNRDYNILLVRDERQLVVSAYYSDQPVGNFTKGKKVAIEGTIREIKSERAYVVHGITASQS